MARTIAAIDPSTRRRGLLVEVHPQLRDEIPPDVVNAFGRRLFERNIRVGMLVTPIKTLILRDLLRAMQFTPDEFAIGSVSTQALLNAGELGLAATDERLAQQVLDYLTAVAASWSTFLPTEAIPLMIPEAVGELAQADFELWDGLLEAQDAR